jgi:hypothetical protein
MINELDMVVLNTDLPDHSLEAGDLGTVALVHRHGEYEVEFMTLDGETVLWLTGHSGPSWRRTSKGSITMRYGT